MPPFFKMMSHNVLPISWPNAGTRQALRSKKLDHVKMAFLGKMISLLSAEFYAVRSNPARVYICKMVSFVK
jgi:hypothetical protein